MGKSARLVLIAAVAVVALLVIVAVAVPLFLNTDSFKAKIEKTLTQSLGRTVTIGKLSLSIWSGGLVAENATVADDPAFSTQPFIQADSVKINVALLPLIFSKELDVEGFLMESPKIQLLRAGDGTWNYSKIGPANQAASKSTEPKQTLSNLTVGEVNIENGRITVGNGPGAATTVNHVYEDVNLKVKDFAFTKSFPFTASAKLPSGGTAIVNGTAGPLNSQDASATPFSGHLDVKHLDPLAMGLMDKADGISGTVDSVILDASWNGTQLHVSKLAVESPKLTVVKTNVPKAPKPANASAEWATMLENLSVDDAEVKNGTITLMTAGQTGPGSVYQQVNAKVTNVTPKSYSPFSASAVLPNGGSLNATGTAGPFNQTNNAGTPLNADITLKHFELGTAGVLPPDAGISGMTDLQAKITSNGQTLNAAGTATVANIKLAKDGVPSAKPVQLQFTVAQNEQAMSGEVQKAVITIGSAVINVSGTYQGSGASTAINLKVVGDSMSINELEAFLPAVGVHLPQGSRLQGGTVTTSLAVTGTTAAPVISGPVKVNNTQLAGFDLGSKLQALSSFTGGRIGSSTGSGTNIRSLSMNIREEGGGIRTDNIALDVAGVGTATGSGTVSAGGALNYNTVLKLTGLTSGGGGSAPAANAGGKAAIAGALAGFIPHGGASGGAAGGIASSAMKNGIPVAIGGTTSNPTFTPDVKSLATSVGVNAAQGYLNGKTAPKSGKNPTDLGNALGGLLGKH
jgi:AsmA protein